MDNYITPLNPSIMQHTNVSFANVDDHILLRNGLNNFTRGLETYAILFEANHGKDFIKHLQRHLSNVLLPDTNSVEADGHQTALLLKRNHPDVRILAVSLYGNDNTIIRMMKNGVRAYILKDFEPTEFRLLLSALVRKGFYYSELITGKLIHAVNPLNQSEQPLKNLITLNDREMEFIKLACTEMTYKEIADRMYLSVRTIDGYRDTLFEKLDVKSRVGLVLYAIKHGLVTV